MSRQSWHKLVASLVVVGMFAGCAQTQDGRLTQAQGAGIGAVGGALAGALIGSASGNAGRGALIGAAAGALGGFAYGTHVANKKAQYASTEAWLDACIASAQKRNAEALAYNKSLKNRVAALESQVKAANMAGDKSQLRKLKGQVAALRKEASSQATVFNNEVDMQQTVIKEAGSGQSSRVSQIRSTTSELRSTTGQIEGQVKRLASLENQIDV